MKKVHLYDSYKQYLREWLDGNDVKVSEMAQIAGCHRTYFSQVLNSKSELTSDHIINLSEYFEFSELETEYFLNCYLYEKSRLSKAKSLYYQKMLSLRKKMSLLTSRMRDKDQILAEDTTMQADYYSDALFGLIHLATSSSSLQNIKSLSEKFNINHQKTVSILKKLLRMGLVVKKGDQYLHSGKSIHLNLNSPFTKINHLHWRMKATEDSYNPMSTHYSNVFTISKNDLDGLREELLKFIEKQNKYISQSGTEEVVVFCCDLFQV